MELSVPPQPDSNIPAATKGATQKQVVGPCEFMNVFPQGRVASRNDASFWPA